MTDGGCKKTLTSQVAKDIEESQFLLPLMNLDLNVHTQLSVTYTVRVKE